MTDAADRHGGTLDRFLGSEAVAVFGVPRAHEDDALRGALAAVELREALAPEGDAVRVGLATGEVLALTADTPVIGDVVAVAAALRDGAPPGGILAAEATHSLVRDAVACIARHADAAALEALVPLVSHSDWSVRAEAIQALAERGVTRAVPPILRRLETEQDEFVRDAILRALKRLEG